MEFIILLSSIPLSILITSKLGNTKRRQDYHSLVTFDYNCMTYELPKLFVSVCLLPSNMLANFKIKTEPHYISSSSPFTPDGLFTNHRQHSANKMPYYCDTKGQRELTWAGYVVI